MPWVHKRRVGDQTVLILSQRLPLGEVFRAEKDWFAGRIPVEVAIKGAYVPPAIPDTVVPDRLTFLTVDEVSTAGQFEPANSAPINLCNATECKNVVLCGDITTVVRKQRAVLTVKDDVLLDQNIMA